MSLFVCPEHGLHHGPFCCDQPQDYWDGTFVEQENIMDHKADPGLKFSGERYSEIHPAPSEFTQAQIVADPILHFFHYAHLPDKLQATSRTFFILAAHLVNTLPRNAERSVALRKLLEAKDAAVRANLPTPGSGDITDFKTTRVASEKEVGIGEPVETGGHDQDRDGPVPFNG